MLGRWYDSKHTGRVGWNAPWKGWYNLTQMIDGARLVQNILVKMRSRDSSRMEGGGVMPC
ncbi:MAG TPA: hypothetical protein ENI98_12140 [Gammaproteobacteria bacterium]|nr:hypothetical protein [Gammaproteobacteria bacterium]